MLRPAWSSRFDEAARAVRADLAHVERLRPKLKSNANLKVGIAISTDSNLADADFPLELLPSLTSLPYTDFYNPQSRPVAAQPTVNLADSVKDFADTAAAISSLDLVITVDASTAHVAGALAKPVWLLLDHANTWPWTIGHDDAPKYATMRIFRQPRPGDWPSVVNAVRHALNREITIRNAPASEWNKLASSLISQSRFPEARSRQHNKH